MAHFAEIDQNNIVLRTLVVADSQEHRGQEFLANDLGLGGTWIQASYTRKIRKNWPEPGFTYDPVRDAFIPPKPGEEYVLNEEYCQWELPAEN